jgi:DNA polymerase III subunit beta
MKITCSKEKLQTAISKAERITEKNMTLPVLSCLILEVVGSELTIKSTNLDIGVEIKVSVKAEKSGIVAVPGSIFVQYISNISDFENITLEVINNDLLITSSKNETTIKTLSPEDFPTIPKITSKNEYKILSEDFINGLKSVWYSASVSNMKPELSSVYLHAKENNLVFVATDSFRLAEKKIKIKNTEKIESVLIPFRNVSEIIKVFDGVEGEIEIKLDNNQIAFTHNGIYLVSRVVEGNFPDYEQIIPKDNTTEVVVLKQDLIHALKLSNIFSDKFNQIKLIIRPSDNIFEIISKNMDKGENKNIIDGTLRGENIEIGFNHKYLSDAFGSIGSDSLTLIFNGEGKPMIMKGVGDPSFMYLIMPLNK